MTASLLDRFFFSASQSEQLHLSLATGLSVVHAIHLVDCALIPKPNLLQANMHTKAFFVCLFTTEYDWLWFLLLLLMKNTAHFHFQAVSKDC